LIISRDPVPEKVERYGQSISPDTDAIATLTAPSLHGDVLTVLSESGARERYRLTQRE